jgi:hypothetical protein
MLTPPEPERLGLDMLTPPEPDLPGKEDEEEEEEVWVNMAETLPESLRQRSTGMDVRMMHAEDLTNLHVSFPNSSLSLLLTLIGLT